MQVVNRLAAVGSAIDDETVTGSIQAFARRETSRRHDEFSGQFAVGILQFREAGDVSPGNHQDMSGGLGIYIPEGQELFIAMHFRAWYFACGDVAEKTGTHHIPFPVKLLSQSSARCLDPDQQTSMDPSAATRRVW
jgi:hypothetical protein